MVASLLILKFTPLEIVIFEHSCNFAPCENFKYETEEDSNTLHPITMEKGTMLDSSTSMTQPLYKPLNLAFPIIRTGKCMAILKGNTLKLKYNVLKKFDLKGNVSK